MTVLANMSMSVDGVINSERDGIMTLFGWYMNGDTEVPSGMPGVSYRMTPRNAAFLTAQNDQVGAVVAGRATFDEANGWNGSHPTGNPVVVLSHTVPDGWADHPRITFCTDGGIAAAIDTARGLAGDKHVAIASPSLVAQTLAAGLLDLITIDLVPALLGAGQRYFDALPPDALHLLGEPTVEPGDGVLHLSYPVQRKAAS